MSGQHAEVRVPARLECRAVQAEVLEVLGEGHALEDVGNGHAREEALAYKVVDREVGQCCSMVFSSAHGRWSCAARGPSRTGRRRRHPCVWGRK